MSGLKEKINIQETSSRKLPSFFVILEEWFRDSTLVTLTKKRFVIEVKGNNPHPNLRQIADLAGANYDYTHHVWLRMLEKKPQKRRKLRLGVVRDVDALDRSNNA